MKSLPIPACAWALCIILALVGCSVPDTVEESAAIPEEPEIQESPSQTPSVDESLHTAPPVETDPVSSQPEEPESEQERPFVSTAILTADGQGWDVVYPETLTSPPDRPLDFDFTGITRYIPRRIRDGKIYGTANVVVGYGFGIGFIYDIAEQTIRYMGADTGITLFDNGLIGAEIGYLYYDGEQVHMEEEAVGALRDWPQGAIALYDADGNYSDVQIDYSPDLLGVENTLVVLTLGYFPDLDTYVLVYADIRPYNPEEPDLEALEEGDAVQIAQFDARGQYIGVHMPLPYAAVSSSRRGERAYPIYQALPLDDRVLIYGDRKSSILGAAHLYSPSARTVEVLRHLKWGEGEKSPSEAGQDTFRDLNDVLAGSGRYHYINEYKHYWHRIIDAVPAPPFTIRRQGEDSVVVEDGGNEVTLPANFVLIDWEDTQDGFVAVFANMSEDGSYADLFLKTQPWDERAGDSDRVVE